ncbi:glycosyltransferase family 4 protein [Clostridium fallax]|uniref:Glycosyltransferase involved in cell wall bisynthesis n=1 Tax=Clostridium fallax TaxID=1533 RepID=A0A1M4VPP0_9CLOT|nr:glycosyltransferase family 4 protein [Clostridium fallax]SHE71006.1 Glycosyltransferase involved in cell wall bisynthesis [Clostridium fallax]SQB22828.1 glycosyltransferase [Clostridium fallax]
MNIAFVGIREDELKTVSAPKRVGNALFNRLRKNSQDNYYFFSLNLENETDLIERDKNIIRGNLNQLGNFIRDNNIDVVYFARYYSKIALSLIWLKLRYKFKLVYTAHGIVKKEHEINKSFSSLSIFIEKLLLKSCDKVIVVSEKTKKELANYYKNLELNNVVVIPNGVNKIESNKDFDFKKELNIRNNKKNILTIGIRKIKNIEEILETFKNNKTISHKANLIVIGETTTEYSKKIIDKYKDCEGIIFKELMKPANLFAVYNNIDLYIQISKFETFGISIVEALLSGKNVILSKLLPIAKYFTDKEVYFYEYKNNNLSDVIIEALNNNNIKAIEGCKKVEKMFNWDTVSEKYEKIFKSLS